MTDVYWTPKEGDLVWFNYPDGPDEPEGRVVAFVPEGHVRAGQPIIERLADAGGTFRAWEKGDRTACAPQFLLPFPYGGAEWKRAMAEGRVVG
jgi:hypothetical protein